MPSAESYNILFGDIHNHNTIGYGIGSLERSVDIARTHLDFLLSPAIPVGMTWRVVANSIG